MEENKKITAFQRHLSLWVLLCMAVGILIGRFLPGVTEFLGKLEIQIYRFRLQF